MCVCSYAGLCVSVCMCAYVYVGYVSMGSVCMGECVRNCVTGSVFFIVCTCVCLCKCVCG